MLRDRARRLRIDQTDAERMLWGRLRDRQLRGAKFRRQHRIGRYIADFCSPECRLIIELDGGHHAEQAAADPKRSEFLEAAGYRVLRFRGHEVLCEIEAVLARITGAVEAGQAHLHAGPLAGKTSGAEAGGERVQELDLRGEVCPYTFLRARLALEDLPPGAVLRVVVDNEPSARDVPRSVSNAGHGVLAVESPSAGVWAIVVRKAATA